MQKAVLNQEDVKTVKHHFFAKQLSLMNNSTNIRLRKITFIKKEDKLPPKMQIKQMLKRWQYSQGNKGKNIK